MSLKPSRRNLALVSSAAPDAHRHVPSPHRNAYARGRLNEVVPFPGDLFDAPALRWRDRFSVTDTTLCVPGLSPQHDGLRVAQLSDVHVGQATSALRIRRAVEAVNRARPDLVFLTGDYVTHSPRPLPRVAGLLEGLRAPTFVVLGNHDHEVDAPYLRDTFERLGYTVLQNAHALVRVRGALACVLGVDDQHSGHADVDATFDGAPSSGTRLVLAHTPPTIEHLPAHENLVQFSGHTHGGQFVVRGLTERIFRRYGQPYIRGHYTVRGNQLYVNRGLGFGFGGAYLRRGSEPELAFFTLRCPAALAAQ